MTRAITRPYLMASDSSVSVASSPWQLSVDGVTADIQELRAHLRTADAIKVSCSIEVDLPELLNSSGLLSPDGVEAIFVWECSATMRRHVAARLPARDGRLEASFLIPTSEIADELVLERQVVLGTATHSKNPLAASHPGAMLWREPRPTRIDLRGVGGILPTSVRRFGGRLDPEAVWVLETDLSDWGVPAAAAVILNLNEAHPDIAHMLAADQWDDRSRAILSVIHWDAGRRLVNSALDDFDFDLHEDYPDDSIGTSLQLLIGSIFSHSATGELRQLRSMRPDEFETRLQAGLSLLRGRKYRRYSSSERPSRVTEDGEGGRGPVPSSSGPTSTDSVAAESATFKQIKMIVGMSGVWCGAASLETHSVYPQPPLTKEEAHGLITLVQEVPDSPDAKTRRGEVVDSYLAQRNSRLSSQS